MGKPFLSELENLSSTYEWALSQDIDRLTQFIENGLNRPLYVVGSGGSFSAATFAALMHEEFSGGISRAMTPLEFIAQRNIPRLSSVLLVTAGGNNQDIISAFKQAGRFEPDNLLVLCARKKSKLAEMQNLFEFAKFLELHTPTGRDGFLATNSLLATLVLLLRAYDKKGSLQSRPSFWQLLCDTDIARALKNLKEQSQRLTKKKSLVVLFDRWTKPAAIDLESKLIEAGLISTQIADFRNFAHGRHNWIAKNKSSTGVIALTTDESQQTAERTLRLLPTSVPILRLSANFEGPVGTLSLIIRQMLIVKLFGDSRHIDPGRPGVPPFGSRIYNLKTSLNISTKNLDSISSPIERAALIRKIPSLFESCTNAQLASWHKAYSTFVNSLKDRKFRAAIFDYDGTLCAPEDRYRGVVKEIAIELERLLENDILVGVATGRGKSVRDALKKVISERYWSRLFIGYYNCSDIGSLDDNRHPDVNRVYHPDIEYLSRLLRSDSFLNQICKIEYRPYQITIENIALKREIVSIVQGIMAKEKLSRFNILESTHSVDIIPAQNSKLELFTFLQTKALQGDILCIGDKGDWPGNDYALLSSSYSLSVDGVSADPRTCWNLAPLGHKGTQALRDYLRAMETKGTSMSFILERLERDLVEGLSS